jgi:hypothetical protein
MQGGVSAPALEPCLPDGSSASSGRGDVNDVSIWKAALLNDNNLLVRS